MYYVTPMLHVLRYTDCWKVQLLSNCASSVVSAISIDLRYCGGWIKYSQLWFLKFACRVVTGRTSSFTRLMISTSYPGRFLLTWSQEWSMEFRTASIGTCTTMRTYLSPSMVVVLGTTGPVGIIRYSCRISLNQYCRLCRSICYVTRLIPPFCALETNT